MFWLIAAIIAVVSYLVGGVNGAIIASKYIFRKDIRDYGSKNAGLTNFYRVFGAKGIALVLFIDIAKTAACTLLAGYLFSKFGWSTHVGRLFSGLFVVIGHVLPLFYSFKGGKGVLATGTIVMIVDWRVGLISLGVFALCVVISRYVSLGSILGGIAFPLSVGLLGFGLQATVLSALCGAILIVKHSENIGRLIMGKESKFSFRRKRT